MSVFAKATEAPEPKSQDVKRIAIFYAIILIVLAVTQLFTFDKFLVLIQEFGFPGGAGFAYLVGSVLVVSEVFALPFLLRMPLSPLFRWFSMILSWVAAAAWIKISLWLVLTESPVETVGFLGTLVNVMPGWWAVLVSVALGILAAWASWGMWPGKRKK